MDYLKISKFTEDDFSRIIESIGGHRFSLNDSKETEKNCDYVFKDSLIELKLVEENLIEKQTKREKLADLFNEHNGQKTIILAPELLTEEGKKQYYKILETSIKTALKKASKQLQNSSKLKDYVKVALIINNGLSLMMPEEFEEVAMKCASNDTSGIDILLIGGNYFFSDGFEHFAIFPLQECYLNGIYRTDIVDSIRSGWSTFLNEFMTKQLFVENLQKKKEPVRDVSFSIDDILFIKPSPKMGKSSFFPNGKRPREDSTDLNNCPPVATLMPKFNRENYEVAKKSIEDGWMLKNNLYEYINWQKKEEENHSDIFRPLIGIDIPFESARAFDFSELCKIAVDIFNNQLHKIINTACKFKEEHQSLNYILLKSIEIGIDKANDIAFIDHVNEFPNLEYNKSIIFGERIKFEYALVLASAYCLKTGANCVYYIRDETYKWV